MLQHETDKQQEKASRQTHTPETATINEEKQNRKTQMKTCKV
jgi:hypothetical protein